LPYRLWSHAGRAGIEENLPGRVAGARRHAARRACEERRCHETRLCTAQPDMPHLTSLLLKMIFTTYKSDAHPLGPFREQRGGTTVLVWLMVFHLGYDLGGRVLCILLVVAIQA
jgi:hypothetical protein